MARLHAVVALVAAAAVLAAAENQVITATAQLDKVIHLDAEFNKTYVYEAPFATSPPANVQFLCVLQQVPYFQHGTMMAGNAWASAGRTPAYGFAEVTFQHSSSGASFSCATIGSKHQCEVDGSQQFETYPTGMGLFGAGVSVQNRQNQAFSFAAKIDQAKNNTQPPVKMAFKTAWGKAGATNSNDACKHVLNVTQMFPVPSPRDYSHIKYVRAQLATGGDPDNYHWTEWIGTLFKQVEGTTDEPVNLKISVPHVNWNTGDTTTETTVRLAATTSALAESAASFLVKAGKFGSAEVTGAKIVSGPGSSGGGGGGGSNAGVIAGVIVALLVVGGGVAAYLWHRKKQQGSAGGGYVAQQDPEAGTYNAPSY